MSVTVYKSTDTSAPVLTGTAGDLTNLLDKCLADGYGSKSAAGWSKAFTATNQRAYRQGAGNQFYWFVDDTGPGAGTTKEARTKGYEVMTAITTGTSLFPTATQAANGLFIRKSATADATARAWVLVADNRTCHLFIYTGDSAGLCSHVSFGEYYHLAGVGAKRVALWARLTENSSTFVASVEPPSSLVAGNNSSSNVGYASGGQAGTGASAAITRFGDGALNGAAAGMFGIAPLPNPADGGLILAPIRLSDQTNTPAGNSFGRVRGMWHFCHAVATAADGDTVSGSGSYAGRTFLFLLSAVTGVLCVESSDTWELNS